MRGTCAYGPQSESQHWQPIDAGHLGAVLKEIARGFFETWLEGSATDGFPNYVRWQTNSLTATDKRIMLTWVYGNAYERLCSPQYDTLRERAFLMTGMLLTLTGENDHVVEFENHHGSLPLSAPGLPFVDQEYTDRAHSASANFVFADPNASIEATELLLTELLVDLDVLADHLLESTPMPHSALVIVGVVGVGKVAVIDQLPAQEAGAVYVDRVHQRLRQSCRRPTRGTDT